MPGIDTLMAVSQRLNLPLLHLLPDEALVAERLTPNRLKKEAEALALLRRLDDKQLEIAVAQIAVLEANAS